MSNTIRSMRKFISFFIAGVSLFLIAGVVFAAQFYKSNFTKDPMTMSEMRETIESSVSWFKESQEISGHLKYEYMPFLDRYVDDDNMVRQMGGLYELGEILAKDEKNEMNLKDTVIRSISFAEENSAVGEMNDINFQCVLKNESKCSLGATSLALVGILDFVERYPGEESTYRDLIVDYKDYILAMRNVGKGFRDSYFVSGSQSNSESSFSNGEAFLALARYYKYSEDEVARVVLDEIFEYFVKEYGGKNFDNNFYLWGMAAIKTLYEMDARAEYYDYVKKYTDWRIEPYKNRRNSGHNRCAYIEGVTSAYSVLESGLTEEEQQYYLEEIDHWLSKSKELQISEKDYLMVRLEGRRLRILWVDNPERGVGGFLTGEDEPLQRIDFTQHCVSSYLQKLVDIDGGEL